MTSNLPSLGDLSGAAKTARTFVVDLAERVVATGVAAAAGVAILAGPADVFSASFWESVAAGGIAAAGSLLKGVLARVIGDKNSASVAPRV